MKTFINILLVVAIPLFMSGCMAEKTYLGKVDVVGIGAGAKPVNSDSYNIDKSRLSNITVTNTPNIKITEQDVSKTVKYVAGEALVKSYTGEPKLLVEYLNSYQELSNKVLILDKAGIVAWSGSFKNNDIQSANGVYDYGFTGVDRMSFGEAMEKYVLDEELADYDDEKTIVFPNSNTDSFMSGFSSSKKFPFLLAKLPEMKVIDSNKNEISISSLANNGKPTLLIFYMSKQRDMNNLIDDTAKVGNMAKMFTGNSASRDVRPQEILNNIQTIYFTK